jgi:F-type H+-transporting ATPase subunit a
VDPLHQFNIERYGEFHLFGMDLSFTNSSFYALLAVTLVVAFLGFGSRKRALVPGRMQSLTELFYEFVAQMVRSTMGQEGFRFFPLIFTIFAFVLTSNLLGMFPYFFTVTSHIAVTGALSLMVISVVLIYGFLKHGLKFFKLFAPSGLPMALYFVIVPIEIISFLARPFSLAIRLFANMMAGHALMKVFASFVIMLGSAGAFSVLAILPFLTNTAVVGLEFLIAFLQAYVFALLSCIYLSDVSGEHIGH